jgi:hypothetical protein
MDAATGLLYVGNGQYYDPSTGRFLTRHAKPDNTNPYVPWNPSSALFAPLALLFLIYGNKRKRSKWDTLVIMLLLGVAVTMSLAACGGGTSTPAPQGTPEPTPTPSPDQPPSSNDTSGASTNSGTATPNPGAGTGTLTVTPTPCPTIAMSTSTYTPSPTGTPTPTSTPISNYASALLSIYGVQLLNGSSDPEGIWTERLAYNAWRAVSNVADKLRGSTAFRNEFHTNDEFLVMKKVGTYVEYLGGGSTVPHDTGAITRGEHLIEFAWFDYVVEDSIRNNVVHELGHAFNKGHGDPAGTMPDIFWKKRSLFLRPTGDDGIMWQLHPPADGESSNNSETFADMFVAHVYNAWVNPANISPNPQEWMEEIVK